MDYSTLVFPNTPKFITWWEFDIIGVGWKGRILFKIILEKTHICATLFSYSVLSPLELKFKFIGLSLLLVRPQ